jgi:MFS family permease
MANRLDQARRTKHVSPASPASSPRSVLAPAAGRWVAQVGPLAVLAGAGYFFQAMVTVVYRDFYARLGVATTEIGIDPQTGLITMTAVGGLVIAGLVALLFPLLSGFLAALDTGTGVGTRRSLILLCLISAVLPVPTAFISDPSLKAFAAFAAMFAALGVMAGLAISGAVSVLQIYLPPVTFVMSLVGILELRRYISGLPLLFASAILIAALTWIVAQILRRAAQPHQPAKAFYPPWPQSPLHQTAIAVGFIGAMGVVAFSSFAVLDAGASRAAEQVRAYGYVVDHPTGLDLRVRPVTVRLLGEEDPLGLCSTSTPAALTQINQNAGEPIVLLRYLNPTTREPDPERSPEVMRLPTDNYVVVQHLNLWSPGKPSSSEPRPWATPACSAPP